MTAVLAVLSLLHPTFAPAAPARLSSPPQEQASSAAADTPFIQLLSPGTSYDPAIPTLRDVVGHDFHEKITAPEELARYLEALATAVPDRTRLVEYARSHEDRPLHALVIGSPERIARLEEVKAELRRLGSGTPAGAEADALVARLPVVTALLHGVHGNEISSGGAAMAEAYHLLAARADAVVELILAESLVLIDPAQNPDGRARFVAHYAQSRAVPPDPAPRSAEHDEPWPGGRTNHYLFDLNRDWFAQTQPESAGRTALLLEYQPHVVVDLHEMGGNSTYYFPPAAPPGNPHTTLAQHELMEAFGRANAAAFDRRGFRYFTREVYDAFYPGYGVSWPTAHGALGMTFEQASARGLVFRREDGTLLTYGDGIRHHFTAALATAETAARNRERLLREYLRFRASAGSGGPAEYVLLPGSDPARAARLARTLLRNGIDVRRTTEPGRVDGRPVPAGAFVVPLRQGAGRLARNLLDPETPMDAAFVERQVQRRARRLPDEIYDVTAWSLPLLWDVEALRADRPTGIAATPLALERRAIAGAEAAAADDPDTGPAGSAVPSGDAVAYLLPWGTAGAAAAAQLLREGVPVASVAGEFTHEGRAYPLGTAVVRRDPTDPELPARITRAAARHGAELVPLASTWLDEGTDLGSNRVRALRQPRVLLVWDRPASAYSAGWARWVLERRYGISVTPVRAYSLGDVRLADWDVVVLPSGSWTGALGEALVEGLRGWLREGGTLVTLAESSRWAARRDVGLLAAPPERRGGAPDEPADTAPAERAAPEQPIDPLLAIAPEREPPEQTPGAILHVVLDPRHWLSAGTDGEIGALVDGTRVFSPITLDRGTNVGLYAPLERLVASGIVWETARPQLAGKAFLVHQPMGRGQVIAFAEDPNYRGYAEATALLFVNAVLLGPGR